ncbi:two pore calcium channel protein 2-like [Anneissia japonica]|uniref:two pore calcium channel protein 2-like n=1 Tax=Anneissia japonica TaxID=1529436 RepID=UPI0014256EB8|nr:two pore calcium channel protein 2-like [Anneissia japonica]
MAAKEHHKSFNELVDAPLPITHPRPVSFKKTIEHIEFDLANQPVDPCKRGPDSTINYTDLYLASTYINDARYARSYKHKVEQEYLKYYALYNTAFLTYALYFFLFLNLSLALFEEPAVNNLSLPYWSTMLMELLCLGYFTFRLVHSKKFSSGLRWWTDTKHLITVSIILLTCIDIILYIILKEACNSCTVVRWSRCLRPLFLVNFTEMRQLRRSFRNIRRTLPEIFYMLILLFIVIGLFALLLRELFKDENLFMPDGTPYMTVYWDNIWHLYVLVTTENSPDIMMPAYDKNAWNVLIFIAYIIICIYILMSIFLAVIYKNYRKHLKNEVQRSVFAKRRQLNRAFDILKVFNGNEFIIPWVRWKVVMKLVVPHRSEVLIRLLWDIIDEDDDGQIDKAEFMHVVDLLNIEISEVADRIPLIGRTFPQCYESTISRKIKDCVRAPIFRYFFDVIITINAFCIGFRWDQTEWFFLTLFTLEIVLKLYTLGGRQFCRKPWNVLKDQSVTEDTLDFLLVLRVLRLVRIIAEIERFKVILATVANIGPSILSFGAVLFVVYYVFAIIGMEVFGGLITHYGYPDKYDDPFQEYCGNIKLKGSLFYHEHYCHNNFNNIINSMILLIELTVVNQWHIITSGFVLVTNKAARLFFILFHMSVVIVVINIFIAFILEVYMVEFSLSSNNFESTVERRINELGLGVTEIAEGKFEAQSPKKTDQVDLVDNGAPIASEDAPKNGGQDTTEGNAGASNDGVRFRLKGRSRNVEVVLQRMFEGELDSDDLGPANVTNIDDLEPEDMTPTPLTFENIT